MSPKKKFVDRLIKRLDRLDREKVGDYLISLAGEKGLLENIFNSMQEGLIVVDPQGKVVLANHPASLLLDLPADAGGDPVERVIRDPALLEIIEQGLDLPGQTLVREFAVVYPQPRWVRLSRSPLRDGEGKFRGITLVLSDVTRQRKAEEEMGLVERLGFLSYLTAHIAHELGNPLSSLGIHVQLIERLLKGEAGKINKKLLHSVAIIKEELGRLDGMVAQFLKALRPESLRLYEENVTDVVEEVLSLVEEELREKSIRLERVFSPEAIRGRMDKNLIKQALLNLIKNAAQAMDRGGAISVRLEAEDSYLKISVADQGTGIPSDDISKVFEPFFTTKETGSGLGLLVVYKVVRQHGGYVEIKSQAGQGSIFTIWLPRRPERIKLLPAVSNLSEKE